MQDFLGVIADCSSCPDLSAMCRGSLGTLDQSCCSVVYLRVHAKPAIVGKESLMTQLYADCPVQNNMSKAKNRKSSRCTFWPETPTPVASGGAKVGPTGEEDGLVSR